MSQPIVRFALLSVCLIVAAAAGVLSGKVALTASGAARAQGAYDAALKDGAKHKPESSLAFVQRAFDSEQPPTRAAHLVLPGTKRQLVFGEGVTSWTLRMLADQRFVLFVRKDSPKDSSVEWLGYMLRAAAGEQSGPVETKLILHQSSPRNARLQCEPHLAQLGWERMPALVGNGIFWTGPRVLIFDGEVYRPARSLVVIAAANLAESSLLWLGLIIAGVVLVSFLSQIPRAIVRDVAINLSGALWVTLALRLLVGLLYGDAWNTLAWHWPVIVPAMFMLCISFACAGRERSGPPQGRRAIRGMRREGEFVHVTGEAGFSERTYDD